MAVLRESPWYQEILQEGEQRGLERGLEQGLEQGLERGLQQGLQNQRSLILKLLTHKIGELVPQLQDQVQALSPDQLEDLGVALLNFSEPADLVAWLNVHR